MAGPVSRPALALLLSAGLAACGSKETRPARAEAPASGSSTGRTAGPASAGDTTLDGGFVARVVDDFRGQVGRAGARGWPAHLAVNEAGRPTAVVAVEDQRARGSADATLLGDRLTDALVHQATLAMCEPGAGETALAIQGEIRAEGEVTWVEVRLFDLQKRRVLARTLLRDPPE